MSPPMGRSETSPGHELWCEANYTTTTAPYLPKPCNCGAPVGQLASACGHPQTLPTKQEIDGCPEVIVRRCIVCERELWWNVDQWRKF